MTPRHALPAVAGAGTVQVAGPGITAAHPEDSAPLSARFQRGRTQGAIAAPAPVYFAPRTKIVALAARDGLPAIYNQREFVDVGGLMGCGPGMRDRYDQAALCAGRALEGVNSGGRPVERSTTFALAISIAAARPLGITMRPSTMAPTDGVGP